MMSTEQPLRNSRRQLQQCTRILLCEEQADCAISGITTAHHCAEKALEANGCAGDYIEWDEGNSSHCACNPLGKPWTAGAEDPVDDGGSTPGAEGCTSSEDCDCAEKVAALEGDWHSPWCHEGPGPPGAVLSALSVSHSK